MWSIIKLRVRGVFANGRLQGKLLQKVTNNCLEEEM